MDQSERVKQLLAANKGKFLCKRCIGASLYLATPAELEAALRPLRNAKPYRRGKVMCHSCGQERECIADS